jgi:hypothetical protein
VLKSHIPVANAPERVEIPLQGMDSTRTSHPRKRGRKLDDSVSAKRGRLHRQVIEENATCSLSDVPAVTHLEGERPSANVHTNKSTRTSEQPISNNLGNHKEPDDSVEEIAINYVETGELYNQKTTIIDTDFVSMIVVVIAEDPKPKSMAECHKRSNWIKWKEAIETELLLLSNRQVFGPVARKLPMLPQSGSNGCSSERGMRTMRW